MSNKLLMTSVLLSTVAISYRIGLTIGRRSTSIKLPNQRALHSFSSVDTGYVVPPLPPSITKLLDQTRLCFMASQQNCEPHLCLMNFTYYHQEGIMILCTKRKTKKYEQLVLNPSVAVLVHDQLSSPTCYSCTLNGSVEIIEEGSEKERFYKNIHLDKNPDYKQFIEGEGIAVFLVKLEKGRLCDNQDNVTHWNGC